MALGFQDIVSYDGWEGRPLMKPNDKISSTLPFDFKIVLALFSLKLISEGFHVAHSFELEAACASFTETICPHTGNTPCDCRLVILLAYEQCGASIPLVFHVHAGQTDVYIDTAMQKPDLDLTNRIRVVLQAESETLLSLNG